MSVTATSVKTLGGAAFAAVADSVVETWLAIAGRRINSTYFGDLYDDALSFLTLHLLESIVLPGGTGGAAGEVSSVRVGSVSVSYATSGVTNDAPYASTFWGRQYLALRNLQLHGWTGLVAKPLTKTNLKKAMDRLEKRLEQVGAEIRVGVPDTVHH